MSCDGLLDQEYISLEDPTTYTSLAGDLLLAPMSEFALSS